MPKCKGCGEEVVFITVTNVNESSEVSRFSHPARIACDHIPVRRLHLAEGEVLYNTSSGLGKRSNSGMVIDVYKEHACERNKP